MRSSGAARETEHLDEYCEVDTGLRYTCNLSSHSRCAHGCLDGRQILALFVWVPKYHELPSFPSFSKTTLPPLDIPCNLSVFLAPQCVAYPNTEQYAANAKGITPHRTLMSSPHALEHPVPTTVAMHLASCIEVEARWRVGSPRQHDPCHFQAAAKYVAHPGSLGKERAAPPAVHSRPQTESAPRC